MKTSKFFLSTFIAAAAMTSTAWAADLTISNLTELKAFRDSVNAGNNYSGKTIELAADIDLGGDEWIPIGNSDKKFQGNFNGNGHTISNLVITGNNNYVGFFGYTTDGKGGSKIENFTINNAKVSGRVGVGAVAGCPYETEYTNISLTGHVEINGLAYVGGMLGRNLYEDVSNLTVSVDETSYVKAVSIENGTAYRTYVGGVIGFMGEGGHTVSNVKSNISVEGSTQDVGGIAGIAHYGNKFENVTCAAPSITLTGGTDSACGAEVGAIVGVWHNEPKPDGSTAIVTFENCTVSQDTKISKTYTNDDGDVVKETLSDTNALSGAAYNAKNNDLSSTLLVGTKVGDSELLSWTATGNNLEAANTILQAHVSTNYGVENYVAGTVVADSSTVYVDEKWANQESISDELDDALTYGKNAVGSIADAVTNVADGGTIQLGTEGVSGNVPASKSVVYVTADSKYKEQAAGNFDGKNVTITGKNNTTEKLWVDLNDADSSASSSLTLDKAELKVEKLKAAANSKITIKDSVLDFEDSQNGNLYTKDTGEIYIENSTILNNVQLSAFGTLFQVKNSTLNSGSCNRVQGKMNVLEGSVYSLSGMAITHGGTLTVDASTMKSKETLTSLDLANTIVTGNDNKSVVVNVGDAETAGTLNIQNGSTFSFTSAQYEDNGKLVDTAPAQVNVSAQGTINISDSTFSADSISNAGKITFSGNSTLEAGVLNGNVTISEGAVLTVASSSLLADETLNLTNYGSIVYKAIDTEVSSRSITVEADDTAVSLSAAFDIVVSSVTKLTDGAPDGAIAAWSFDVENGETEVTVSMDADVTGLDLNTLTVWHKADGENTEWQKTDIAATYDPETGKVSFTASSFSSYAITGTVIPEPSAFGLLAGIGALALVAARRRRK